MLHHALDILRGQMNIGQNGSKEPSPYIATGMIWYDGSPTIWMFKKDMASLLADIHESKTFQNFNKFSGRKRRQIGHTS